MVHNSETNSKQNKNTHWRENSHILWNINGKGLRCLEYLFIYMRQYILNIIYFLFLSTMSIMSLCEVSIDVFGDLRSFWEITDTIVWNWMVDTSKIHWIEKYYIHYALFSVEEYFLSSLCVLTSNYPMKNLTQNWIKKPALLQDDLFLKKMPTFF